MNFSKNYIIRNIDLNIYFDYYTDRLELNFSNIFQKFEINQFDNF